MSSIFLSHSSRDKFFVRKLADRLRPYGIKVWLDEAELKVGDSLVDRIGAAIDETDFVGVVLSHNSVQSQWVQKELQMALQKELSRKQIVILPLLLDPVDIPPFLRDKVYADFTSPDDFDESFRRVLEALGVDADKAVAPPGEVEIPEAPSVATRAGRRLAEFEDIRVVNLDDKRTYNPDASRKLYYVYLELSSVPPEEWQRIFEAERKFPRHTMWRHAWAEGQYIVVHCVPEELEKYHLADVKEDLRNSNVKYRQYVTELAQEEARESDKDLEERRRWDDLKRRLDFD